LYFQYKDVGAVPTSRSILKYIEYVLYVRGIVPQLTKIKKTIL